MGVRRDSMLSDFVEVQGETSPVFDCQSRAGVIACGATGYGRLYGIAAWGSDIIGFARNGSIVRVSGVDGTGCLVASTSSLWAGAGISTLAPVIAPP
jgi:hypothetical protein